MILQAKYSSACVRCGKPIFPGEVVFYAPDMGTICDGCRKLIAEAEQSAYIRGMELLQLCGVRSGRVWNHGVLEAAVSFGVAAQFQDNGKMTTVERYKLRGVPLAVQTVHLPEGGTLEYLWGPADLVKAAEGSRSLPAAPAKVSGRQSAPTSKQSPGPSSAPASWPPRPSAPPEPIVVEPLPELADDPQFRSPKKSEPDLAQQGLVIGLDKPSGLFWARIATTAVAAMDALKTAGFRFHVGSDPGKGEKKCHNRCLACMASLPDHCWYTRNTRVARRFLRYLDPEARQVAEDSRTAFEDSRAASANITVPVRRGLSYYPYQLAGVRWCMERPSVLLSDQMGLGKTIQILGFMNADETIKRVLVICPASLTLNWRDEAKRWLVKPTTVQVVSHASQIPTADRMLLITNFEMLIRGRGGNLHGALLSGAWDLIAVDEAHRLCNQHEAKISQAVLGTPPKRLLNGTQTLPVLGILSRAMRRVLATGTPFRNRPREMWPLVHALDPVHFPNEYEFLMRYCGGEDEHHRGRRKFDGSSHLDELQDRLRSKSNNGKGMMIRRLKSDVLPELPPKTRQIIALPVPKTAARLVNVELKNYARDRSDIEAALATADMMALRGLHVEYRSAVDKLHAAGKIAFNRIAALRHEVGRAKAPVVVEHLKSMLDGGLECVLVFAHHHDVIDCLVDGLAKYKPVKITGKETTQQKHDAVRRFQNDTSCRVVVGNIAAAGEGVTLNRASTVVICELTFVPGQIEQVEDRAHRIGQRSAVLVQHLVFDGSVDQRIVKILVEKTRMSEQALDIEHVGAGQFSAEALKLAAEQRLRRNYPDEVRLLAQRAIAGIVGFRSSWAAVGNWLAAQSSLNDWQCDLALRCLRYHRKQVPDQLRAQLAVLLKKKGANQ